MLEHKLNGYVNIMFFIKLKADIFRYMAENSDPGESYSYTKEGDLFEDIDKTSCYSSQLNASFVSEKKNPNELYSK